MISKKGKIERESDLPEWLKNGAFQTESKEICNFLNSECEHSDTLEESDKIICLDCGKEIRRGLSMGQDWRYSGENDKSNPSRCSYRKLEDKGILKELEVLNYSQSIKMEINDDFNRITKNNIYRKKNRRGLIFACTFNVLKLRGQAELHSTLCEKLGIKNKCGTGALRIYALQTPKNAEIPLLDPIMKLHETLNKISCSEEEKKEIIILYNTVKNQLNNNVHSNFKTIAYGIILYYFRKKNKVVNFDSILDLSINTKNKVIKNIDDAIKLSK